SQTSAACGARCPALDRGDGQSPLPIWRCQLAASGRKTPCWLRIATICRNVVPPKKRTRNSRSFSLLCYRRNRVTLSPEPLGFFALGLLRQDRPSAVDCP